MRWKNAAVGTSTFFISATINSWQPLFNYEIPRDILIDDFIFYRNKYNAKIIAYVIMPEHYHTLIELEAPSLLPSWLRDIQSHTANEISKWLRNSTMVKDNSLWKIIPIFRKKAEGKSILTIWKEQARAEGIFTIKVLRQKIEYIHANPVRRGLVQNPGDWPWSSWKDYYEDNPGFVPIDWVDL
jgi:REP element-mobilizing transposase RayT